MEFSARPMAEADARSKTTEDVFFPSLGPFAVTFFDDHAGAVARCEVITLAELARRVATASAPAKADLPWLKLATFGNHRSNHGSLRHNRNLISVSGVEIDYDGEKVSFDTAVETLEKAGLEALVYTSPSHLVDGHGPRWRLVLPFITSYPPKERSRFVSRIAGLFRDDKGSTVISGESWTHSQAYYYGRVNGSTEHRVELVEGLRLDHYTFDELDLIALDKPTRARQPSSLGRSRNGGDSSHKPGPPRADIADIRAALAAIANSGEPDWLWWNDIGLATHSASAGSAEGYAAFVAFSERNDAFDLSEAAERWQSYTKSPPNGIGFGTLVYWARVAQPSFETPGEKKIRERREASLDEFNNRPVPPDPVALTKADDDRVVTAPGNGGRRSGDDTPGHSEGGAGSGGNDNDDRPGSEAEPGTESDPHPDPPPPDPDPIPPPRPLEQPALYDPWPEPEPAPWPPDVLPVKLHDMVFETAMAAGADPGVQALATLAAVSGAAPKNAKLFPYGTSEPWWVPPIIWAMIVARSGFRKTALDTPFAALQAKHDQIWRNYSRVLGEWQELSKAEQAKTRRPPGPHSPIINDASVEQVQVMLARTLRGSLYKRDELAAFIGFGRYGTDKGAAERTFYLESYEAGPYTVLRLGRDSVHIAVNGLTVYGCIQPARLKQFEGLDDDGLLQRFIPYLAAPPSLGRSLGVITGKEEFDRSVAELAHQPGRPYETNKQGSDIIRRMEADAIQYAALNDLGAGFSGFCAKLHGTLARLALILHLLDDPEASPNVPIMPDTVAQAERIVREFVLPNALAFYSTIARDRIERTRDIAGWLLTSALSTVRTSDFGKFVRSCRDLSTLQLNTALDPMITGGWLHPETPFPNNRIWTVDPHVRIVFSERAIQERARRKAMREMWQQIGIART